MPGHFTASAFVLSPERDAVLLIHHRKLGRWLQPGGHIDPADADVLAAARRELAEETGLVGLPLALPGLLDVDVHEIPPLKAEPAHQHFDLRFAFLAPSRAVVASEEVAGARWFALDEVDPGRSDRSVTRAVARLKAWVAAGAEGPRP